MSCRLSLMELDGPSLCEEVCTLVTSGSSLFIHIAFRLRFHLILPNTAPFFPSLCKSKLEPPSKMKRHISFSMRKQTDKKEERDPSACPTAAMERLSADPHCSSDRTERMHMRSLHVIAKFEWARLSPSLSISTASFLCSCTPHPCQARGLSESNCSQSPQEIPSCQYFAHLNTELLHSRSGLLTIVCTDNNESRCALYIPLTAERALVTLTSTDPASLGNRAVDA